MNRHAAGFLSRTPFDPTPRTPPVRSESAVTTFDFRSRDPSRSILIGALCVAAILITGLFYFARVPADVDLAAGSDPRRSLPRELVQAALTAKLPEEEGQAAALDTRERAASEGPARPSPPRTVTLGSLHLRTDPAVDVYDENQYLGRTPLNAKLRSGIRKLRFTDKATGLNVYRTYRLTPEREIEDVLSFGTSELVIDAPIGSAVLLNSRPLGKAPLEPVTIYEGRYHLKVVQGTKSWADWFDAPPGRKIAYRVTLPVE